MSYIDATAAVEFEGLVVVGLDSLDYAGGFATVGRAGSIIGSSTAVAAVADTIAVAEPDSAEVDVFVSSFTHFDVLVVTNAVAVVEWD